MILGSIGEWIVGNTFPFVVFGTFGKHLQSPVCGPISAQSPPKQSTPDCFPLPIGAFWGAFGCTLVPWFNAYGAYVTDPTQAAKSMGNPGNPLGLQSPSFNASFAFFLLFMGMPFLHPTIRES